MNLSFLAQFSTLVQGEHHVNYAYTAAEENKYSANTNNEVYKEDAEVAGVIPSFKIKNGDIVHAQQFKTGAKPTQSAQTPYPTTAAPG